MLNILYVSIFSFLNLPGDFEYTNKLDCSNKIYAINYLNNPSLSNSHLLTTVVDHYGQAETLDFGWRDVKYVKHDEDIYYLGIDPPCPLYFANGRAENMETVKTPIFKANTDTEKADYQLYWEAMHIKDYYKDKLGYVGYDNKGGGVYILKNAELDPVTNEEPVSELSSREVVTGSVNSLLVMIKKSVDNTMKSTHTLAHEIFHGTIGVKTGDFYARGTDENQAIMEAYCDISGVLFAHYINERYDLGLNIWENKIIIEGETDVSRNFMDPNSNLHADTYMGSFYHSGTYYQQSTIFSHWFYLLSEGKSGSTDYKKQFKVNGIGIEKAKKIWWELFSYFEINTSPLDFRKHVRNAAFDIFGDKSSEYFQALNALYAIGLELAPPEAPTSLEVKADGSTIPRRLISADMVSGMIGAFSKQLKLSWNASVTYDTKSIEQYWIVDNGELLGSTTETSFEFNTFEAKHEIKIIAEDSDGELSDPAILTVDDVFNMDSDQNSYIGPILTVTVLSAMVGTVAVNKWKRIKELKTKQKNAEITPEEEGELESLLSSNTTKCE